ncbi:MAG TPA: ABC transporter permease [Phenylobacterium sp.]
MFALTMARRYLTSNPAQTALLLAGVALGVTVFVFITALIEGLAVRLTDQVTANSAHVSLEPETRRARILGAPGVRSEGAALVSTFQRQQIRQWRSVVDQIRTQEGVAGISPQITGSAFLVRGEAVQPVAVTGLEAEGLDVISPISSRIVAGTAALGADGVLVGERLAEDLGLSVNQPVLLRTDRGAERLLTIRGVYRTGLESLDSRVLFLSLQTARPLFRLPEGVTNIEIKLDRPDEALAVAHFLKGATGLRSTPWQEKNESLDDALRAQGQTGQLIQIFSLVSIVIGVASALVLSAYRRRPEIGIMRAAGISSGFIARVFILQGLLIGLTGALFGCAAGYGLCRWLASITGPGGEPALPIAPERGGYLAVFLLTTLGAVAASAWPARSASKVDPLEAIQL